MTGIVVRTKAPSFTSGNSNSSGYPIPNRSAVGRSQKDISDSDLKSLFNKFGSPVSSEKAGKVENDPSSDISNQDREMIQSFKSKAVIAFSMKRYSEAENYYMSALNLIDSFPQSQINGSNDPTMSVEAIKKMKNNIDECRLKQGLGPFGEPDNEVW
jgi:hypothetical protein